MENINHITFKVENRKFKYPSDVQWDSNHGD